MFTSTSAYGVFFCTLFVASLSNAQLVGCDAVDCPNNPNSKCKVGNTTLGALGISEFKTTISPEPLTWTVGTQGAYDISTDQYLIDRDFFVGTPSSLQLANSPSVHSCALFFEGIASRLEFSGKRDEFTAGTCNDALNVLCVNDLMSQSRKEMEKLLTTSGNNGTELTLCASLQTVLQYNAPKSCTVAPGQNWGEIMVRGPKAPSKSLQVDCHPTTGKDYDVSLVLSVRFSTSSATFTDSQASFIFGITPIMTVFYSFSSVSDSSKFSYEAYLNCMKTVGSRVGEVGGFPDSPGLALESVPSITAAITAAAFVTYLTY